MRYKKNIKEARAVYSSHRPEGHIADFQEVAENQLLAAYYGGIQEVYSSIPVGKEQEFLGRLESLLDQYAGIQLKDKKLRKLLRLSLYDLPFSNRAKSVFANANFHTVSHLVVKTEKDLLKYQNFGRTSLQDVKRVVSKIGLKLGMIVDESLLEPPLFSSK